MAFTNFVRSVLLSSADNEREDYTRLAHAKHNVSVKGDDMLYTSEHIGENKQNQRVRLVFTDPGENVDADAVFDRKVGEKNTAATWLLVYLRESGEVDKKTVIQAAVQAGYTKAAIEKAHGRGKCFGHRMLPGSFPPICMWFAV